MKRLNHKLIPVFGMLVTMGAFAVIAKAQEPAPASDSVDMGTDETAVPAIPLVREFKAVDADNHTVVLNKTGIITLVLYTTEDSQDAARLAGKTMYPFQGRPDFQLVVVVDLRDSIANWVPSVTISQMRSNLDKEAIELKPYFLKNGNKSNPRDSSHVIADFNGATCSQLGWSEGSENLRGILYGADAREIKRWDKISEMDKLQADVRNAIEALLKANRAHAATTPKKQGTKINEKPATPAPPLPPTTPPTTPPANTD
jgi:hypothetical protein